MEKRLGYEYSNRDDKHKSVSNEINNNIATEKSQDTTPKNVENITISSAHKQLIDDINIISGIILSPLFNVMSENDKKSYVTNLIIKVQIESELSTTKRMVG